MPMINDAIGSRPPPLQAPLFSRRSLVLFGTIAVLWTVLAWFAVERQVQNRVAAVVARETFDTRRSLAILNVNLDLVLNRLQGLAAVLAAGSDVRTVLASFGPGAEPSLLPHKARKAGWTQRPDLSALNRQLFAATEDMNVDIIWLMNASGDCVAASNATEPTSFVGTNYADRSYFTSAQAGKRGQQYAMGRVTKVPGLFFSAPVTLGGRFLGAVTIKNDLPHLASAINHPGAFVTDEQGVIILATDRSLEMRALPGAAVHQLPAEQRLSRYLRLEFDTLSMIADSGPGGLVRLTGRPHPHVAVRSELPRYGIAVHILEPIEQIESMRRDAIVTYMLLAASGIMLVALVFGARAYVLRVREYRKSIEATNESLKELNEHLDSLSRIDPLTSCANRRQFQERLEVELERARRYGRDCSLLVIDLDFFKKINDMHGHAAGDEALRHFVRIVRGQLRSQDEIGRMGGEEFSVLLPETGPASAVAVAERIRRAIEAAPAQFEGIRIPLTASFGVACWKSPAEPADALVQRADKALYAAKSGGRNRVATGDAIELRPPAATVAVAAPGDDRLPHRVGEASLEKTP